jgi:hypothetical protein
MAQLIVMRMDAARLARALVCALFGFVALAAEPPWPTLPTGLTSKRVDLGFVKSADAESVEVSRGTNRIAQITKLRHGGQFQWFSFKALVEGKPVYALSGTQRGGRESSQFFSLDDTIVRTDVRIPGTDMVALVITSKKHGCHEIFTRPSTRIH